MSVCHLLKELLLKPHAARDRPKSKNKILFPCFALISLFLGPFCGFGLSLTCNVYDDAAVVAAACRARTMRHTGGAALACGETPRFKRKVSPMLAGLAPVMPHPYDHKKNIPAMA